MDTGHAPHQHGSLEIAIPVECARRFWHADRVLRCLLALIPLSGMLVCGQALACPACAGRDGASAAGTLWLLGAMIAAPLAVALVVGVAVHRVIRAEADQASAAIAAIAGVGANETIDDHRAVEAESP